MNYLAEESVQTMDFLLFLNIGIELSDSNQGQFLHQIDFIWSLHMFAHEEGHRLWESRRIEHDLTITRQEIDQTIQDSLEILRKQFVGLNINQCS